MRRWESIDLGPAPCFGVRGDDSGYNTEYVAWIKPMGITFKMLSGATCLDAGEEMSTTHFDWEDIEALIELRDLAQAMYGGRR